jgi:hypothetical protein
MYSDSSIMASFVCIEMLEYELVFPEIFFDVQPVSVPEYKAL